MNGQGYEQLTLYREDFHASPFPWLETKKAKGMTVISGRKCSELSENLRHVGLSVRTYLESCELPGERFVRTWSVRDTLSPFLILKLRLSEHITGESGYSLLPTVTATIGTHGGPNQRDSSGRPGLQMAAMMWPTPSANDCKPAGRVEVLEYRQQNRRTTVQRLRAAATEPDLIGGALNPTWVEWLMGFPTGWTDLNASETP